MKTVKLEILISKVTPDKGMIVDENQRQWDMVEVRHDIRIQEVEFALGQFSSRWERYLRQPRRCDRRLILSRLSFREVQAS